MGNSAKTNKLAGEKSPYLLQHATNPVEWYPWGEEALALSKKTGKPIFLSIGYSTCHWCHVMAHESFENEKTAALMNQHFINIKVDREERPDIDAIYMTAVQALTGGGGWPMSVWLTPDLKPFFGGTYFAPDERYGRPGFPAVIAQLAEIWESDRERATHAADQMAQLLTQSAEQQPAPQEALPELAQVHQAFFNSMKAYFDSVNGGFGPAPKFPMPAYMFALLDYYRRVREPKALEMVSFTMKKIAAGGIYDQLGGGFARYSTDDQWVVPHFEKMLYDNAQLISVCADLFDLTKDPFWEKLTRHALTYALRDLRHPEGAFFAAEDADSEGKEGTFYVWTLAEIKQHLPSDQAEAIIQRYGPTVNGNFFDPHTGETGKNVLVQTGEIKDAAVLATAEKTLFEVRGRRPRPHRDEKIIVEWNGLMISALSKAGKYLNAPEFTAAAVKAADFIQTNVFDPGTKRLFRRWRDGDRKIAGLQTDYAMLGQGLLDLFDATADQRWLAWATELQETQDALFFDATSGGYFMSVLQDDLLIRMKDDRDGVIPSGNSIAALNGLRLSRLTGRPDFAEKARRTLQAFGEKLRTQAASLPLMTVALGVV